MRVAATLFALIFPICCGSASAGGAMQCLADAVEESERKYMMDDEGGEISVGLLECNWASSALITAMAKIWIGEVLGYHCHIHPEIGAIAASPIWALAGCTTFDDANDKGCGLKETRIHVALDSWIGSYASQQEAFKEENPDVAAIDLGSMGYSGVHTVSKRQNTLWIANYSSEESIYVSMAIDEKAQTEKGLALTYYQSYNTSHHDPKQYFGSVSDVDWSELLRCNESDFSNVARMNDYALYSGDSDGVVQQPDGSYFANCTLDDRWWLAPAYRDDSTKCIPTLTSSPGWKVQAMMQWTAAYGFPAAIAISNKFSNFVKHVETVRALHYWWVPDSTFIEMQPQPIVFPRHVASEWAKGNKRTGGYGSYISKMVSSNLRSKASLVQDFVAQINFELLEVQDLLLHQKQSGLSWEEVACDWIKEHRKTWTEWIPDETACDPQFGLFNEKTQEFVADRTDRADLACRACPSGHFSKELEDEANETGKTYICRNCSVGRSQASGASLQCDPCSRGEYQDEEAMSSCKRCNQGEYQGKEGQGECLKCPEGTTTLGYGSNDLSDCGCKEGTINLGTGTNFQCVPCGDGMDCPFSSTKQGLKDGESLLGKEYCPKILSGFYASPDDPLSLYKCEPAYVCPGGQPGTCLGGLQGDPCAVCPLGQFLSGDECVECGSTSVFGVLGILLVPASLIVFYYFDSKFAKVSGHATVGKVNAMAFGLTVNALQTVALMGMMTVDWSDEMSQTTSGLQFMVLDVKGLGLPCFFGSGATGRYVGTCMFFPCMILWILNCWWMTRVCFSHCARHSRCSPTFPKRLSCFSTLLTTMRLRTGFPGIPPLESLKWTWPNTFNVVGVVLKVGFSTVSAVLFQPMTCYSHPNGKRSLLKFSNVICGEGEHSALLAVGLVIGSVFVFAFFAACLYAAYKLPSWSRNGQIGAMHSVRFLVSDFRLDTWWFGIMPLLRGFSFSCIIAIATDAPAAQTSLFTAIILTYCVLQAVVWPWKAPIINVCDVVLSFLMLLLVGRPAMKQVMVHRDEHAWDFSRIFTFLILILMALCICFMFLIIGSAILVAFLSHTDGKKKASDLINLAKQPRLQDISILLQKVGLALSKTDADKLVESLAAINHYDFQAVMATMSIIGTEVVASPQLVSSMASMGSSSRIALKYKKSKSALGSVDSMTSHQDNDHRDKNDSMDINTGDSSADASGSKEDGTTEATSQPTVKIVEGTVDSMTSHQDKNDSMDINTGNSADHNKEDGTTEATSQPAVKIVEGTGASGLSLMMSWEL